MRATRLLRGLVLPSLAVAMLIAGNAALVQAADRWIEVKSPHFTVVSNDSDGETRTVAWQFEQIRGVLEAAYPWARLELNRPLTVIALKDEVSMRAAAPGFWEQKGGVRPSSVWVGAPDRYYLALRTDVRVEDRVLQNPHLGSYFSYVSLILRSSFEGNLPPWLLRGLAGVWSNTIVRNADVVIGAPIRYHLDDLRNRTRMPLAAVLSASGANLQRDGQLRQFDAHAWALVHFLMFSDNGSRGPVLNQLAKRLAEGGDAGAAVKESLGPIEPLDTALQIYINRSLLGMGLLKVDARVKRESFPVRQLPVAEHSSIRAAFHTAMDRPAEARSILGEGRKADGAFPEIDVVEAVLFDREQKPDDARASLVKAVERGSTNAYAHYRLATLLWRADADKETMQQIDTALTRAIALDNRHAAAYAFLAEVRAAMTASPDALSLARRAIALEPAASSHHLAAARVLWRLQRLDEARQEAATALTLADSDEERRRAQAVIDGLKKG